MIKTLQWNVCVSLDEHDIHTAKLRGSVTFTPQTRNFLGKSVITGSRMFTTKNRRQCSVQPTVFFCSSWSESEEKHLKKASKGVFRQNIQRGMGELKHYFFHSFSWRLPTDALPRDFEWLAGSTRPRFRSTDDFYPATAEPRRAEAKIHRN